MGLIRVYVSPDEADAFRELAGKCQIISVRGKNALKEGSPAALARFLVAAIRQVPGAHDILKTLLADVRRSPNPAPYSRIELSSEDNDVLEQTAESFNILRGRQLQSGQLLRQIAIAYKEQPDHVTSVISRLIERIPNPPDLQSIRESALSNTVLAHILHHLDNPRETRAGRPSEIGIVRTRALLPFFLLTGLRLDHIRSLQWKHLSVHGSTVTITNPLDLDRHYVVSDPDLLRSVNAYLETTRGPLEPDDLLWDLDNQKTKLPFNANQFLSVIRHASGLEAAGKISYTALTETYARLLYEHTGQMVVARRALVPFGKDTTDVPLRLPIEQ